MTTSRRRLLKGAAGAALAPGGIARAAEAQAALDLPRIAGAAKPRSIVLILSDDHRYDALGFLHPFLETPHLDSLAKEGVHCRQACVTTALCSPSRASILTGQYAHRHRVVDNNNPVPADLTFFPQYLQKAGYETAFIGKWHMGGDGDAPQRGFDHWVSFRGQGVYRAGPQGTLNVDGKRVPRRGYITDELTDYAVEWLKARPKDRPFFLFLSHKAVHSDFVPAERHAGRYKDRPFTPPKSMDPQTDPEGRPMWVKNQRNSHHGVDFPYHGDLDVAAYYRRYCETLLAVDDSVGRVLKTLGETGRGDETLVVYTGDNGFAFGEHGLIDKRTAYEESMRVPMLMRCPDLLPKGGKLDAVVANIDLAPTFLEAAGLRAPTDSMDGRSFLPLARGEKDAPPWRDVFLYEYYWERSYPQTPTVHAVRGERYKYVRCHGLWDLDELYDLKDDPLETRNLARDPAHLDTVRRLNRRLWDLLEQSDGMRIPLLADRGIGRQELRSPHASESAPFPPAFIAKPTPT